MKVFWGVVLFNLIACGLALLSVILYPAEMKAWMTTDIAAQLEVVQQKAQQQSSEVTKKIDEIKPIAKETPKPKRTPPPALDPEKILEPEVEAKFEGDYFGEQSTAAPPPAGLYPFSLRRRTTEGDMLEIEILMKNASGFQFKNVNIFMRSEEYPRTQLFTLDNWRADQIALLKYKFPISEKEVRLKNLRVTRVTGEEIGSIFGGNNIVTTQPTNGEVQATPAVALSTIKLAFPDDIVILKETPDIDLDENTPERTEILDQFESAYASLYGAQEKLNELLETIESAGFEKTMVDGRGLQMIQEILDTKAEFSKQATRLSLNLARSKDAEAKALAGKLTEYSSALEDQIRVINNQIPLKQYKIVQQ